LCWRPIGDDQLQCQREDDRDQHRFVGVQTDLKERIAL
jgi:hypothetical protein